MFLTGFRYVIPFFVVLLLAPVVRAETPRLQRADGTPSAAAIIKKVTPAVVTIIVRSGSTSNNPLYLDPYFRRFFGPGQPPTTRLSVGSGVIVNAGQGHVLTNYHLIRNARKITVKLKNGRSLVATLIGSDPGTDIAVLKIDAKDLVELPLGDSTKVEVGDYVLAIGNPFGIGQTVTSGIISAVGRRGLIPRGYESFIQTDASINPGNSGGALVTLKGELIGINTAIVAPSGGSVGIGFAIPSSIAKSILDQLVKHGRIRRGRLGVVIQNVTADIASALGIGKRRGALVKEVQPGTPAAKADIKVGDIIVAVDGRTVSGSADLRIRIGLTPPGTTVAITLIRGKDRMTVRATLAEAGGATPSPPRLTGATLADVPPGEGKTPAGVSVTDVEEGSSAWQAGLRRGDIITAVNRKPVANVAALNAVLQTGSSVVVLTVMRNGGETLVIVR